MLEDKLENGAGDCGNNKWRVKSIDIKSGILQGRFIEREVVVKPPNEAGTGRNGDCERHCMA